MARQTDVVVERIYHLATRKLKRMLDPGYDAPFLAIFTFTSSALETRLRQGSDSCVPTDQALLRR